MVDESQIENEKDFAECSFWLTFIAETLPHRAGLTEEIRNELRERLDPARKAA